MQRGEIYLTNLDNHGNVQKGFRPVIVIQNDKGNYFSPTVIVCSITSKEKPNIPTHVDIGTNGGLSRKSTVLCEQIHTINKSNLRYYVGQLSNLDTLRQIDRAILISLGIKGD